MKKTTLVAAFAAACLAASAGVRDSRSTFAMQQGGADHTMLRPENVILPQGYKPRAQRRIKNDGFAPAASLVASNWSVIENEDGAYWFYTQEFETVNDWYYGASDFTVYNDRLEKQVTIHFDAPEGETCNSIQPFGMITRKFFDVDDKTWEMLVYVHCITADYTGKNYIYVVNNRGEVIDRFDGYSAQFVDYGTGLSSQRRLLIGGENKTTGKFSVDVMKKAGWNGGATVEHTFEIDTELINYSDGPAVNAYNIDNDVFYTLSHYEKPYSNGYDSMGQPTVTPDNNYMVEVFDANFQPVTTVKDPVQFVDNGYSMRTFGYFGYDDLNRSYNADGSKKLDVIITNENYYFNSAEDTYLFGWSIYNEDNEKLNEFGGRTIDWWSLSPIKGQSEQVALYTFDEEGAAHIELYDLPSCELVAGFDDTVDDLPISTAFDRAPVGDGYEYVVAINRGYTDDAGNVLGVIAWITTEGKVSKTVNFNLGPNAEYFTAALSPMTLNPYVFDTDDDIEYLYRVKTSRGNGSEALDDIIVIADHEGNTIRRFASDDIYNTLNSCDVLYGADGKPFFLISYYASAYNDHYGETDINIYSLPFSKWPGGGDGSADNPYVITSVGDLMQVSEQPAAHYAVANDLDFGHLAEGWTPIHNFSGTLEGNNHVLRGFSLSDGAQSYYAGLFGELTEAKVKDLIFEAPELQLSSSANYAGVLAGFASANTDVDNVIVFNPRVSGSDFTGQYGTISGYAGAYVTASQCVVSGADVDLPAASEVGGIYGFATASGVASACSVDGKFNAYSALGGIIGRTYLNSYAVNSHADVELTAHHYVGGIVGDSEKRGTIDRCFAEGTVRATGTDREGRAGAGGIVGYLEPYWGGENDNPVGVKQSLSAVNVEGAGVLFCAHRIAGATANDYMLTEEEIAAGKTIHEDGVITNYATAPEVEGMDVGLMKIDGETIAADALSAEFLAANLQFAFGQSADAPWTFDGKPILFTEPLAAGIAPIIIDADKLLNGHNAQGVYDVQGRRLDSVSAPGLYIIGGRKTIVK